MLHNLQVTQFRETLEPFDAPKHPALITVTATAPCLGEPLVYCSTEIPTVAIKHIYISIKPGCSGLRKALRCQDKEHHGEAGCTGERKKPHSGLEISIYFQASARKAHQFDDYLNICGTFVKSCENSIMYKLL